VVVDPWRYQTVLSAGFNTKTRKFSWLLFASCTRYGSCETFSLILSVVVLFPPNDYVGSDNLIVSPDVKLAVMSNIFATSEDSHLSF